MPLKQKSPLISVVLSLYNEEAVLPELIRRLHKSLNRLDIRYEFIFVDDASTDGSLEFLEQMAKEDEHIKVLRMSRNFGSRHGVCVLAGVEHSCGEAIIFMDTDLQDPPEVLPEMIEAWLNGDDVDVVYTTRLSRAGESKLRLWLIRWGYSILRFSSEVNIPSDSGDFKLISRRVADYLLTMDESRPFLRGLIPWIGFKQVPVYYHRDGRHAGESKRSVLGARSIDYFLSAVISFTEFPLKYCILFGCTVALGAFVLVGYALLARFFGISAPGSAGILAAVFFLGGLQLIMIGILGLYISAITDQVKHRPRFIIDRKIGFDGNVN